MIRIPLASLALAALVLVMTQLGGNASGVAASTSCASFGSQSAAQYYYSGYPSLQPVLDPDNDGIACEEFFAGAGGGVVYTPYLLPAQLTLVVTPATIPCNGQATVTARLLYADGVGVPRQLLQFTSTLGTVYTNLQTDAAGYVTTTYVAPYSPGPAQITVAHGSMTRTLNINVDCPRTEAPKPAVPSPFTPPATGDAGLAAAQTSSSTGIALAAIAGLLILSSGAGAAAYARVRR